MANKAVLAFGKNRNLMAGKSRQEAGNGALVEDETLDHAGRVWVEAAFRLVD